jgi:hypothetical protein
MVAKTAIVERHPCNNNLEPCFQDLNRFDYFNNNIFPEEVDDIKNFMTNTFTTNVNGFTDDLITHNREDKIYNYNKENLYYNGNKFINQSYDINSKRHNIGKF